MAYKPQVAESPSCSPASVTLSFLNFIPPALQLPCSTVTAQVQTDLAPIVNQEKGKCGLSRV